MTYRGALAGGTADLRYTVKNKGIEEDIILSAFKTDSFASRLTLEGLRPEISKTGNLLLYNSANVVVAYAQRPYAFDAKGKMTRNAGFTLAKDGAAYVLTTTVDANWLKAPDRAYPVTIDPWWSYIMDPYSQDAFISGGLPDNNFGSDADLSVGYDSTSGRNVTRSLVQFDLTSMPVEQRIIDAQFSLKLKQTYDNNNLEAKVYRLKDKEWKESEVTWWQASDVAAWSAGGAQGDYWTPDEIPPSPPSPKDPDRVPRSFNNTVAGNKAVWWVTDIAREWYADQVKNQGLIVIATNENQPAKAYYSREGTADINNEPTLWVMYEGGFAGIQDYWTYVSFPLGDGQVAMVNAAGGNLVLRRRDWDIASAGINSIVDRIYNSTDLGTHDFGHGAMASIHPELTAYPNVAPRAQLFFDPGGAWHAFEPQPEADGTHAGKYYRPRGLKATLNMSGTDYLVQYDSGITYRYDSNYNLISAYDRNNNTITYQYDQDTGKLISITDTATPGRNLTLARGDSGNIRRITDTLGRFTGHGNSISGEISSFRNQRGKVTQYRRSADGAVLSIVDPKGQNGVDGQGLLKPTSEIVFDPMTHGWRVHSFSYIKPDGNKDTWTFTYDTDNHNTFVRDATQPSGNITMYTWDQRSGAVKQIFDPSPYQYNVETRNYGDNFNLVKTVDMQGQTWLTNYDFKDEKVMSTADPKNVGVQYFYDDPTNNPYFPTRIVDEQKNTTNLAYFTNGNLQSVGFKLNNTNYSAGYSYNANGTLNTSTDPRGFSTHYYYTPDPNLNPHGDLRQIADALNQTITMSYDNVSRMTQKTDAKNQTTTYGYDNQDRVTGISYSGGGSISFTFDGNGNLQSMADSYGTTTFEYDYRNQLVTKTLPGNPAPVFQYEYSPVGKLTKKIYGSNTTQYTYDERNLLTMVTDNSRVIANSIGYDADHIPTAMTFPGPGVTVTSSHNEANRLLNITSQKGGNILAQFDYTYQNNGVETALRRSMTYSATGKATEVTNYAYDEMNHLKQANTVSPVKNRSWVYDANGNRTVQTIDGTTTMYGYDALNRLYSKTVIGGDTTYYSWDNNGNYIQVVDDQFPFGYDGADKNTSWGTFARSYTGRDQTERVSMESSKTFLYNGKDIAPTIQTSGSTMTRFITSPGGGLLAMDVGGTLYYYLFDGSGSVVGLVDSTGTPVKTYSYEPFGGLKSQTGTFDQPYRFHGGYYDGDQTGLYKMGARYYSPEFGRFTQPEPAWSNPMYNSLGGRNLLVGRTYVTGAMVGQGTTPMPSGYYRPGSEYNWYSYAGSDPINGKDVTGYWNPVLGAIAFGIGVPVTIVSGVLIVVLAVPSIAVGEVPVEFLFFLGTAGYAATSWGLENMTEGQLSLPEFHFPWDP